MANRRMISFEIYHDDRFTDLDVSARLLYTYLVLVADDDGFFTGTKQAVFLSGATDEDLQKLTEAGYLYKFESGVYVIKHWKLMNTIQKDRYKPTIHLNELAMLKPITEQNKIYELACIQNGNNMDTQYSLNQYQSSIVQDSISKDSINQLNQSKSNSDDVDTNIGTLLQDEEYKKALNFYREKIGCMRSLDEYFKLNELLNDYGIDTILVAIDHMSGTDGRSVNYLEKILETRSFDD